MPSLWLLVTLAILSSCNKKAVDALQSERDDLQGQLAISQTQLNEAQRLLMDTQSQLNAVRNGLDQSNKTSEDLLKKNEALQLQIQEFEHTQADLLDVLQKMAVLNPDSVTRIRQSVDVLREQDAYLENLGRNLTSSLPGVASEDLQVEMVEGTLLISLSDKLLFPSASAQVQAGALPVLEKLAQLIQNQPNLQVVVTGHTDNIPIKTDCLKDNWDLSAQRAGSVIRVLRWRYNVAPERMILLGKGQYDPKTTNDTNTGRQLNRRTEITLRPSVGQLLELAKAPSPKK